MSSGYLARQKSQIAKPPLSESSVLPHLLQFEGRMTLLTAPKPWLELRHIPPA